MFPESQIETAQDFHDRFMNIRSRVDKACLSNGRDPHSVRILVVTKTVDEKRLRLVYETGCRYFGENKVQEFHRKSVALGDLDIEWSVIGHLQTNKVKYVARFAHEFQALDSLKLAESLDKRLQSSGRSIGVLVQVNSSGEDSKYGLRPEEVPLFIERLRPYQSLEVRGLMTLAIFSPDHERVRKCFSTMRMLRDRLRDNGKLPYTINELSMGMSGDFELAIAEGATVVRIGQALFGRRPLPDSHYWPMSND